MNGTIQDVIELCQDYQSPAKVIEVDRDLLDGGELRVSLAENGFFTAFIDAEASIKNKHDLLSAFATTCSFPAYYGFTWDALKDCLCDFSWLQQRPKGFIILYANPLRLSWSDLFSFFVVFNSVSLIWASHKIPFKLLLPKTMPNDQKE